jgi:outer membrane protein OmpA-like peptidoglycan-associated protein
MIRRRSERGGAICLLAITIGFALATGGCSTLERNRRAATGTAVGAATGAGAGAAIGAIAGNKAGEGAAIGAIVGALGGGAIGAYMDKQERDLETVLGEQGRVQRRGDELAVTMSGDLLFETGEADLAPGAQTKLARIASVLTRYPETEIDIVGHTDSIGSYEVNQKLSQERANVVADELVQHGVDPYRVDARGVGASQPLASNESATGRARNRRVEIEVVPL